MIYLMRTMVFMGDTKMNESAAYHMGRNDYSAGKAMSDNHFKVLSKDNYRDWVQGWKDAVMADPLLDADEKAGMIGEQE